MKSKGGGPIAFKQGQSIITEGAPGKEMFIVEEGKVEIFRQIGSEEKRVSVLEPGDFFGEMSIIDDLPRGASARALSDCMLLAVDHSTFDQMLRRYPDVAIRMLRKMSARVRELQAALEERDANQAPKLRKSATVTVPASTPSAAPAPRPASVSPAPPTAPATPAPAAPRLPKSAPPAVAAKAPLEKSPATREAVPPKVPAPAPQVPEAPAAPRAWRLVLFDTGAAYMLPEGADIRVGRFDSVTGTSPEIDLTEADVYKTTSRRHAKFVNDGGRLIVKEEIGTANGTFVNGKRIATGTEVELNEGDWIQFGGVKTFLKAG